MNEGTQQSNMLSMADAYIANSDVETFCHALYGPQSFPQGHLLTANATDIQHLVRKKPRRTHYQ